MIMITIVAVVFILCVNHYHIIKTRKEIRKEREQEREREQEEMEEMEENILEKEKELIQEKISIYKQLELSKVEEEVKQRKEQLECEIKQRKEQLEQVFSQLEKEKEEIINSVLNEKRKRDAINAEAVKEKEQENYQEKHTISINDQDFNDITTLLKIEKQLTNKKILRKLIWSEYLQKPFNDMIKNIFGGKIPSNVIYYIENIDNNKKYIGLTKQLVSKRWTDHIKTSLEISGTTQSTIHKELFGKWNSFIFDVLEVVEDDTMLREREKFYIDFFDTSVFGYNIKK